MDINWVPLATRKKYVWHCMLMLSVVLGGCSSSTSPDAEIREYLQQAVNAGESRDVSALADLISDDYEDTQQRKAQDLTTMAMGYFLRNRSIHLFYQIDEIKLETPTRARVGVNLATAGQPISGIDSLLNLRADLIHLDLLLVKQDGDWLLQAAQWQRALADDFQPPALN